MQSHVAAGMATEKSRQATTKRQHTGDGRGLVYVGHLPHGFYEEALHGYFSQFGTVTKVKVARNKKVRRVEELSYYD